MNNISFVLDPKNPKVSTKDDIEKLEKVSDTMYNLYKSPDFKEAVFLAVKSKYPAFDKEFFGSLLGLYAKLTHKYSSVIYGNGYPVMLPNAEALKGALPPNTNNTILSQFADMVVETSLHNIEQLNNIIVKEKDPTIYVNPAKVEPLKRETTSVSRMFEENIKGEGK